jgi:hypothetical protein
MTTGQNFLSDSIKVFNTYKALGEKAFNQLRGDEINAHKGDSSNSIALIVKHLRGNMLSRWTDFLTTDGEKPNRNRDTEFEGQFSDSKKLIECWEEGWACLFATLDSLSADDLSKTVYIRREPLTVMEAILRQIAHYAYHVGQIVYLAKEIRSGDWKSLSIPKGKSEEYK